MKRPSFARRLTDREYVILMQVYANHNSSMGLEMRKKYTLSDIDKIKINKEENCLEVFFSNGDWWKYHSDGTWS